MQRLRICRAHINLALPVWQLDQRLISATACSACTPATGEPLYRVISDLEESGKGRRVSKVSWKDDNFWHIVDVSEHPRSIGAQAKSPTGSDEQHEGNAEEVASEDVQPGVKDIPPLKLPSVFAIKFVDGAPTTGRVVKMKQIFKREWRLLPQQ